MSSRNRPKSCGCAAFRCRSPRYLAVLRIPLAVSKILVGPLISDGLLDHRGPIGSAAGSGRLELLRAVLDGIRKL
ncbi:DUF742 domain-containing protein [Nocardia sp. NPDC004860]|uniref:DUF742 domain-containing protein n=1 Tax=Nocardia sp. NPDC004860 TaxID=3154557 RepID=UPI0033A29CC2